MGGFPFQTQSALGKIGCILENLAKKHTRLPQFGCFLWQISIVMDHKSRFSGYRDGRFSEVNFERPRTKIFEDRTRPRILNSY